MSEDEEFMKFMRERDALFAAPSIEAAQAWWIKEGYPTWKHPSVPLAVVHKARLQWLGATSAMLAESIAWLKANDYESTMQGAPPLTPESRDAQRLSLGKKPLDYPPSRSKPHA